MSFLDRFGRNRDLEEEVLRLRREIRSLELARSEAGPASVLLAIARALRDARTIEVFADTALEAIVAEVRGASGALVLPDERGELRAVAARGPGGRIEPSSFKASQGILTAVARDGHPIASGRAAEDARLRAFVSVKTYDIDSVLCLPVRRRAEPTGCLYLTGGEQRLRQVDPAALLAVADLVSIALDRLAEDSDASRRERLEAVGLAAASLAHDLNNPLACASYALAAANELAPAARASIDTATKAIGRALEIARGLAIFARGVERTLELVELSLPDLVAQHQEEMAPLLAPTSVTVETNVPAATVRGDRSALLRVLGNVARNAVEAMPGGGRLRYRGAVLDRTIQLSIEDTGPGIPVGRLTQLFRPFATFGKVGGCGLGLALAQDLMRAMNGRIQASSLPDRGACFSIELPRA